GGHRAHAERRSRGRRLLRARAPDPGALPRGARGLLRDGDALAVEPVLGQARRRAAQRQRIALTLATERATVIQCSAVTIVPKRLDTATTERWLSPAS